MSELASNAKKRGDKTEALRWYREAFEKSEGPATRLQWGASYVSALVDLAPGDEAAIESTTAQLWREAATQPDAFYERSGRSLQRVGKQAADLERGRRARGGDGAPARPSSTALCADAGAQRRRARDLPRAARAGRRAERLSGSAALPAPCERRRR